MQTATAEKSAAIGIRWPRWSNKVCQGEIPSIPSGRVLQSFRYGSNEIVRVYARGILQAGDGGEVTGHDARLDGVDGGLLKAMREVYQLWKIVELATLCEGTRPGKDSCY